jgi:hypothetical protein
MDVFKVTLNSCFKVDPMNVSCYLQTPDLNSRLKNNMLPIDLAPKSTHFITSYLETF